MTDRPGSQQLSHSADVLREVLDACGVRYDLRSHEGGMPYAAFRLADPEFGDLTLSALVLGTTFRLTLHHLLPGPSFPGDLWLFDQVNQDWSFGRVFYNSAAGEYQAAIGLHLPDGQAPAQPAARFALHHLVAAAKSLRDYQAPVLDLPAPTHAPTMADIERLCRELEWPHASTFQARMTELSFARPGHAGFRVQAFLPEGVMLVLRGVHSDGRVVERDDETASRIHELNGRLGLGTVACWTGDERLYYQLVIPLAWYRLDAALMSALVDQVGNAMDAIDATFFGGGGTN